MDDKKYFIIRIPKSILMYIYILLCIVIVVLAYNNWPRYVVLNPPIPDNGFILSEEKKVYNPYTASGVLLEDSHNTWTWKREYDFPSTMDNARTLDSVLTYFDTWLNDHEWKKFEGQGDPCARMTKAGLLEKYLDPIAYVPENTTGSYYSSIVCLAAWPYTTDDNQTGFTILLFTATK